MKKTLRQIRSLFIDEFVRKSYSQEGEDIILDRIFEGQTNGFYIDIGAHHPKRFSNTYLFYKRGWSGINVEPNPDVVRVFKTMRPRDINLQCGISVADGFLKYYYFNEPALNTFDEEVVRSRLDFTSYKLVKTEQIPVYRLDKILSDHVSIEKKIDFLSVDVEGFDLMVLKSNDWCLFRPTCVLAEVLNVSLEDAINGELAKFMQQQGYTVFARTYNTLIFRDLNNK